LRETRDGKPGPGTLQRVLELELLARSEGDFTASRPSREGTAFTGAKAAAATKCSEQGGAAAGDCFRLLGLTSVEVRPDGVFTLEGPMI